MSERKSNKQRRAEIKQQRLARIERLNIEAAKPDPRWEAATRGHRREPGVEPADRALLARTNNTVGPLPEVYLDRMFTCRDCGEQQVWTAKQQKWWYEVAGGSIDSMAVRCLPCRRLRRAANARPGADLLGVTCARIGSLGEHPPNAAARAEVEAALNSKWWGVRVAAIATLGHWGSTADIARLKAWVWPQTAPRYGSWEHDAQSAAARALSRSLPQSDAGEAIAAMLGGDSRLWMSAEWLAALPAAFWEPVIQAELQRDEPARLIVLIWLLGRAGMDTGHQRQLHQRLARHPDRRVADTLQRVWPATA